VPKVKVRAVVQDGGHLVAVTSSGLLIERFVGVPGPFRFIELPDEPIASNARKRRVRKRASKLAK
jgi:hypothetical protein